MRINLVATGGTIGSRVENGEYVISEDATKQIALVLGASKVFSDFKIHSAGVDFAAFNMLKKAIEAAMEDKPDGVVVTHGTDTLAFSSAYLAYTFVSTRIPIVMCTADKPLTDYDSNGFDVLRAAKSFIARGESGVFVLNKNPGAVVGIHHGAQLVPAHLYEDFYFSIGGSRSFHNTGVMRGFDFELKKSSVLCITPYVGMNYGSYDMSGIDAVLQVPFHSGKINVAAFNAFASSYPDIPMFFPAGLKKYDPGTFVKNIVQCPAITQTALYIKLLIAINNNVKDLASFVLKDVCGEIVKQL